MTRVVRLTWLVVALHLTTACAGYVRPRDEVLYVHRRPPRARLEVVVAAPGPGHVWVSGWWVWRNNDYRWEPGRWMPIPNGRRQWDHGRWRHDRYGWFWSEGRWRQ